MPTVTLGSGLEYEVYADVDTANVYLEASFSATAWRDADDTTKGRALVSATRQLDALSWNGEKTDPAQTLQWPRSGLTYPDGTEVPEDEVPIEIVNACCELAAMIIDGTFTQNSANIASGTRRLKAGSAEIEYFRNFDLPTVLPQPVLGMVNYWLASSIGVAGSESYGTCEPSSFRRGYGFTRGF